jgi:hypothetical protein
MFFLPYPPEKIIEEARRILKIQQQEAKPSSWAFNEFIVWEDRFKDRLAGPYGKSYHISSQVLRVADREITLQDLRRDLDLLHRKYWSPRQMVRRWSAALLKISGLVLLFLAVWIVHSVISRWVGNPIAAGIIIGVLVSILLIPQGVREFTEWYQNRTSEQAARFHQSLIGKLVGSFFPRCPQCGKCLSGSPDPEGYIICMCGNRVKQKKNY